MSKRVLPFVGALAALCAVAFAWGAWARTPAPPTTTSQQASTTAVERGPATTGANPKVSSQFVDVSVPAIEVLPSIVETPQSHYSPSFRARLFQPADDSIISVSFADPRGRPRSAWREEAGVSLLGRGTMTGFDGRTRIEDVTLEIGIRLPKRQLSSLVDFGSQTFRYPPDSALDMAILFPLDADGTMVAVATSQQHGVVLECTFDALWVGKFPADFTADVMLGVMRGLFGDATRDEQTGCSPTQHECTQSAISTCAPRGVKSVMYRCNTATSEVECSFVCQDIEPEG